MSYAGSNTIQHAKRAQLVELLEYVAGMIDGPGGEAYLPIFQRVEEEIQAISVKENAIERARRILSEKAARGAR